MILLLAALASPYVADAPAPPSLRPCITTEIVQHDVEAMIRANGNPPTLVGAFPTTEGMVLAYWIVGSPAAMNYVFADGCLTGQFPSAPPKL